MFFFLLYIRDTVLRGRTTHLVHKIIMFTTTTTRASHLEQFLDPRMFREMKTENIHDLVSEQEV